MSAQPLDIDAIVREVLAKLAAVVPSAPPPSGSSTVPAASATSAPAPATPLTRVETADLTLTDQVVTVDSLAAAVTAGTRRLIVSPRAVVTPSARDWLRARAIELTRVAAPASNSTKTSLIGKLYLHATRAHSATRSWGQRIVESGWELESLVPCDLVQAAAELAAVLSSTNRLGVLLTNETTAAVCLANRHAHVRAAVAASVDDVRVALRQIQVNLLIADPARAGDFVQRRMIQEFLRFGPRDAPRPWRGDS